MTAPYYCGCTVNFNIAMSDPRYRVYCEMHHPDKPWADILNSSSHWNSEACELDPISPGLPSSLAGVSSTRSHRYIGGYSETQLHKLFWIMGGIKPPAKQ
jgi:hypothetical protein